jgi:hypothetical protein
MKPYKKIFTGSVVLTILLYLVDIYILDPIAPDPSWRYRIVNFSTCQVIYTAGFFVLFSFTYLVYTALNKYLARR